MTNIKVNGNMIKDMAKAKMFKQMVTDMKVNGKMITEMVKGLIIM